MSILSEITDGIKLVGETIKNIKEIHEAIKDGKVYFEKKHPEIKKDVIAMCEELQKTCHAIATASGIITHFKFNSSPGVIDNEPTRFNNYFISYKTNSSEAENLISSLKGHCHIIRNHAEKISQGDTNRLWELIGLQSQKRQSELAALLQEIYNDEKDFHSTVYQMAKAMNTAIEDVTDTLSKDGMLTASKIPEASDKLNQYAKIFKELQSLAEETKNTISDTIQELQ